MAARRKQIRRSRTKTVSLWNLGVGWVYLTSFTKMATGCGPVSFLLGDGDLAAKTPVALDPGLADAVNGMGRYQ